MHAVFPSDMSAPIVDLFLNAKEGPKALPATIVPGRRMGNEQDMGGTMLYLASKAGAYCNGAVITIDGGRLTLFPSTA